MDIVTRLTISFPMLRCRLDFGRHLTFLFLFCCVWFKKFCQKSAKFQNTFFQISTQSFKNQLKVFLLDDLSVPSKEPVRNLRLYFSFFSFQKKTLCLKNKIQKLLPGFPKVIKKLFFPRENSELVFQIENQ